jgi:hypothetical protein
MCRRTTAGSAARREEQEARAGGRKDCHKPCTGQGLKVHRQIICERRFCSTQLACSHPNKTLTSAKNFLSIQSHAVDSSPACHHHFPAKAVISPFTSRLTQPLTSAFTSVLCIMEA